jgi:hypothetical protein
VWTQKCVFIEHRKGSNKSSVGFYYLIKKNGQLAKCNICLKEIHCGGGSTSGLHMHQMTLHGINLRKRDVQVSNLDIDEHELTTTEDAKAKFLLTDYFKSDKGKKLSEVLACMAAYGDLLFHFSLLPLLSEED